MSDQIIKCIAIDDEPVALDILINYCGRVPFLELRNTYRNALDAIQYLQNNKVDLIFLDINMPEISGIDFIRTIETNAKIIFTTAYPEFAVESYDLNALDYLLKPITFERFLKAVNKINSSQQKVESPKLNQQSNSIMLKSGSKSFKIDTKDILFIEGSGNYLTFHTKEKNVMALMSMNEALELLPVDEFARIHKSYIVALDCIKVVENHQVQIAEIIIPVGKYYKESFFRKIKG